VLSSGVVPAFHFALRHRYLRGAIRRCARDGVGPSTGKGPQANGTGAHRRAESVQLIARDACSPKPNEQLSPGRHVTMAIESVGTRGQSASASLLLERLVWVRLIAVTQPVSRRSVPMPSECRANGVLDSQMPVLPHAKHGVPRSTSWLFRAGPDTRAPDEWFEAFNDDRVIHPYLDEGQSDKSRIPT